MSDKISKPSRLKIVIAVLVLAGVACAIWIVRQLPAFRLQRVADAAVQDVRNGDLSSLRVRHEAFHNTHVNNRRAEAVAMRILVDLIDTDTREEIMAAFALGEGAHNYGFTPVFKSRHKIIMPHAVALAQESAPDLSRFGRFMMADMLLPPDAFHAGRESWPPTSEMIADFRTRKEKILGSDEAWSKRLRSRME